MNKFNNNLKLLVVIIVALFLWGSLWVAHNWRCCSGEQVRYHASALSSCPVLTLKQDPVGNPKWVQDTIPRVYQEPPVVIPEEAFPEHQPLTSYTFDGVMDAPRTVNPSDTEQPRYMWQDRPFPRHGGIFFWYPYTDLEPNEVPVPSMFWLLIPAIIFLAYKVK